MFVKPTWPFTGRNFACWIRLDSLSQISRRRDGPCNRPSVDRGHLQTGLHEVPKQGRSELNSVAGVELAPVALHLRH